MKKIDNKALTYAYMEKALVNVHNVMPIVRGRDRSRFIVNLSERHGK
jgi:hypothetical protein